MTNDQFTYRYPRPALTVDCVVFGLDDRQLKVMLIERDQPPFEGRWALPGGFMDIGETLEVAARRELEEETGIAIRYLEQLSTFDAVDRDPRERVITVAYYALVKLNEYQVRAASDARRADWFPIGKTPPLAFDHAHILKVAIERLRNKVRYQPLGFDLLPSKFTLRQLQHFYETILGRALDKRNFRKKILGMELLVELNERETGIPGRPARLYHFDKRRYQRLMKQGLHFDI